MLYDNGRANCSGRMSAYEGRDIEPTRAGKTPSAQRRDGISNAQGSGGRTSGDQRTSAPAGSVSEPCPAGPPEPDGAPGSWRHSQTGSSPRWRDAVRLGQEHLAAGISARLVLVAGPLPPFPGQPVQIDQPGAVGCSYGNEPPGNEPPGPPQRGPRGPPWEKRVSELPSPVHRSGMLQPAQPGWGLRQSR